MPPTARRRPRRGSGARSGSTAGPGGCAPRPDATSDESSSRSRRRAIAVTTPLWGRARAAAGWMTERLAANASKLSAAAICMLSMRSAASTSTSEPRPIVTPLELISPSASLGPSTIGSRPGARQRPFAREGLALELRPAAPDQDLADVGHLRQVALAHGADHPDDRVDSVVEQLDERLDELAPDADARLEHAVDARHDHRAHDVGGQRAAVEGDLVGDGGKRERARSRRAGCGGATSEPRPGVQAVDGTRRWPARGRRRHAPRARRPNAASSSSTRAPAASDGEHMVDGQAVAGEDDRLVR